MNLYTEQQMRDAIKMARNGARSEDNIIDSLNFIKQHTEVTMSNNKQSSNQVPDVRKMVNSVEWFSNQVYELFEQYSEGNFDRITLNKLVLEATEQAKEMEVAGKEMSYSDGYREGYKRALELTQWVMSNLVPKENESK